VPALAYFDTVGSDVVLRRRDDDGHELSLVHEQLDVSRFRLRVFALSSAETESSFTKSLRWRRPYCVELRHIVGGAVVARGPPLLVAARQAERSRPEKRLGGLLELRDATLRRRIAEHPREWLRLAERILVDVEQHHPDVTSDAWTRRIPDFSQMPLSTPPSTPSSILSPSMLQLYDE
jgi:hypothetical protein